MENIKKVKSYTHAERREVITRYSDIQSLSYFCVKISEEINELISADEFINMMEELCDVCIVLECLKRRMGFDTKKYLNMIDMSKNHIEISDDKLGIVRNMLSIQKIFLKYAYAHVKISEKDVYENIMRLEKFLVHYMRACETSLLAYEQMYDTKLQRLEEFIPVLIQRRENGEVAPI